ncbi:MAG: GatB/YqeY domain-containing protein [bacterium]
MGFLITLQDEMKTAMKAGDPKRLSAIRMLVSAIRYAQIDDPTIDEDGVMAVLKKEAKKRREAVEAYTAAGRTEAAENEAYELAMIEGYLPKQLTEEDVRAKVEATIKNGEFANFGLAMNAVMKVVGKEVDGGMVARIVKETYKI